MFIERINEGESMLSEDKLLPASPGVRTFGRLQGHGPRSSELQTFFLSNFYLENKIQKSLTESAAKKID